MEGAVAGGIALIEGRDDVVEDVADAVGSAMLPIQGVLGVISVTACISYQRLAWMFGMVRSDLLSMMSVRPSIQFCCIFWVMS